MSLVVDEKAIPVEDRLERLLVRFEAAVDRLEVKMLDEHYTDTDTNKNNDEGTT